MPQQLELILNPGTQTQQLEAFPSLPPTEAKRCGTCCWHHDLFGSNEKGGVRNCLARGWPEVEVVLSTEDAICDLPSRYRPRAKG